MARPVLSGSCPVKVLYGLGHHAAVQFQGLGNLLIAYARGSQSVVRVPLVVREISLVVRRGISELNINQAACPPKRFFLIVLNGSVFFMLSTRAFFSWHREFKNVSIHHCHFLVS